MVTVLVGDARTRLREVPDRSVQMCVTSPPYFGLRDYGVEGQMGLEQTPEAYVAELVGLFREVRRVLKDDGTVWLNLGDSYFSTTKGTGGSNPATSPKQAWKGRENGQAFKPVKISSGDLAIKPKDLIGIPWRVAFALQADGWWLRQDIIWHKPNPMPESVRDRCTKAHEYLFLLTKSERYYWDTEAAREPAQHPNVTRKSTAKSLDQQKAFMGHAPTNLGRCDTSEDGKRNRRSVWTIPTSPYHGAHFATFPPALIEPCILIGSRPDDLILDPFGGSGTTGMAASQHGRNALLCELNATNVPLMQERVAKVGGDFVVAPDTPSVAELEQGD